MYKKVGVIGIDLKKLKGEFGSKALELSGNNFGNMLFTNAVYNQIPNSHHIGFNFDPKYVRENFDHIVIPASNWINGKENWGFLADLLEEANLPVCLVGLGCQLEDATNSDSVSEGTIRFLKTVSKLSRTIGVRGEFTKDVMAKLGFPNTDALGCPSIFTKSTIPEIRRVPNHRKLRTSVGPTRYHIPKGSSLSSDDKQRKLYQFAINNASSIYYQSEAFEIALLNREDVSRTKDDALNYYGLEDWDVLEDNIMRKGKYHKDLDQWITDLKKDDVYIGTRIHGAITAILAGTPPVLVTHDNRTKELAKIMGVPNIDIDNFNFDGSAESIDSLLRGFDFSITEDTLRRNLANFKNFYQQNGLSLSPWDSI